MPLQIYKSLAVLMESYLAMITKMTLPLDVFFFFCLHAYVNQDLYLLPMEAIRQIWVLLVLWFILYVFATGMLPREGFPKSPVPCEEVSLPLCHREELEVLSINQQSFMVHLPRWGSKACASCISRLFFYLVSFFNINIHSKMILA